MDTIIIIVRFLTVNVNNVINNQTDDQNKYEIVKSIHCG